MQEFHETEGTTLQNKLPKLFWLFVFVAAALYITWIGQDFFGYQGVFHSSVLKYSSIILCLLFAVWIRISNRFCTVSGNNQLIAALAFTVCADWFLLFPETLHKAISYPIGVSFFCLAQIMHKQRVKRFFSPAIVLTAILIGLWTGYLLGIRHVYWIKCLEIYPVCLYAWLLLSNIKNALDCSWPAFNRTALCAGMILFLCCDICVALYQMAWQISFLQHTVLASVNVVNFSWVFYLPSQLLLVVSSLAYNLSKKKSKSQINI